MSKTILITGATDGIGLATAKMLVPMGHTVLLHGRNPAKLQSVTETLSALPDAGPIESYEADLSNLATVETLAQTVTEKHSSLDVLINNAGVLNTSNPITSDGLDVRFVVNTLAPYLLTQRLLPLMNASGRVVNLSSAAQRPVHLDALAGRVKLPDDFTAYAQSKLAITMWSRHMALALGDGGPAIIAVNPGSLLNTNMVKDAFGATNNDIGIGADILTRAALSDEFATASGSYYDNDSKQFAPPHGDALDAEKTGEVVRAIEAVLQIEN